MSKSTCDTLQYIPSPSEVKELHSTSIANCVFNGFLSHTAIMFGIVTIHAIRKTSLPKPLKTLLLSLAAPDLGVGVLVQPFYVSLLVKWSLTADPGCAVYKVFITIMTLFSLSSFFGIAAISVDRFLAIHLHLRYQELVTRERVVVVVISIWLLSAFLSIMPFWSPVEVNSVIFSTVAASCFVSTTIAYIRIFLVVQRHKNQIETLQMQEVQRFASVRNSSMVVFYVYLVYLVCYLPQYTLIVLNANNEPSTSEKRFALYSWTLIFLNSSLNPLIYCWKMRNIRHAILDILRNFIIRRQ